MIADVICYWENTSLMALDGVTSFLRLKDVTNTYKRMRRGLSIGGSSSSLILVTNIHRQARASQWIWQYVDWPSERSKPMKIGLFTSLYNKMLCWLALMRIKQHQLILFQTNSYANWTQYCYNKLHQNAQLKDIQALERNKINKPAYFGTTFTFCGYHLTFRLL